MNGIFYSATLELNDLIHEYVPVSAALSEDQIAPSLTVSVETFLRPLLGDTMLARIETIATDESPTTVETMVLDQARRAAINLALWFNFDELNTHFTDQGWKREEGDTYKTLYHYQEIDLKRSYRNKGWNALDGLINLLQAGIDTFTDFATSPAYIDRDTSLVKDASVINRYYQINSSPLVFIAIRPQLLNMQENELQNVIGSELYDLLVDYLEDNDKENREDYVTMEKLRDRCAAYVICLALARQVLMVGTLTDRGVYYATEQASDKSSLKVEPVPEGERKRIAGMLQKDASRYLGRLLNYIEDQLPDYYKGRPGDAFRRNNDYKRTFWT